MLGKNRGSVKGRMKRCARREFRTVRGKKESWTQEAMEGQRVY